MTTTKFKADFRLHEITPIKVVKETPSTCTLESGEKLNRFRDGIAIKDTYEAAKIELIKNCERGIDLYAGMLETELKHLKKTMEL